MGQFDEIRRKNRSGLRPSVIRLGPITWRCPRLVLVAPFGAFPVRISFQGTEDGKMPLIAPSTLLWTSIWTNLYALVLVLRHNQPTFSEEGHQGWRYTDLPL
jgi:hypothetical protein